MAVTRQKKKEILGGLAESLKKSKSFVFSGYQGLSVKDMSLLRREIRKQGGEYKVAKKTLIKLAARKHKLPEFSEDIMPGACGIVFGYEDEIAPFKVLHQFGKTHPQVTILGGFMEGKILNAAAAKILAALPGKQELYAKLVGSLKSPLYGLYAVLSGLLRGFVFATAEYQKKMAAAAAAAAESASMSAETPAPQAAPSVPPQTQ